MFKFWKAKEENKHPSEDLFRIVAERRIKIEKETEPVLTIMNKYRFLIETLWQHYNVDLPEFTDIPNCYFDPDIICEIPFLTQEDKRKLSKWGKAYEKANEQYLKICKGEL